MSSGPRILLFTGPGKGKTTAALGLVLRAAGHGLWTGFIQFIKSAPTGELQSLTLLKNVEIIQTGLGFLPAPGSPAFARHKAAAEQGLERAGAIIVSGNFDVVVLDEICLAVHRGLLEEKCVIEIVHQAQAGMVIVLTGREASENLMGLADTVTEMRCVKHGLHSGHPAQKGVEL
jgi:cob(I)alamin adenosyltransferase